MNTNIDYQIAACDNQMYGVNCSQKCGACVDNEACHHINGSCLKGCDRGYHGQKCDQGKFMSSFLRKIELRKFSSSICCKNIAADV